MGTVNMSVDFGGVKMQNPINTAAGTFGYGWQFQNFFDVSQLVPSPPRVALPSPGPAILHPAWPRSPAA